jgi:hypothetical protein
MMTAPLKPELIAPIRDTKARPPQPNQVALLKRRLGTVTCSGFNGGGAIASAGAPGAKCAVHNSPSQYLC